MNMLGELIRHHRKQARHSLRSLGIIAGISHTYIRDLEVGSTMSPTIRTLVKLARALKVSPLKLAKMAIAEELTVGRLEEV